MDNQNSVFSNKHTYFYGLLALALLACAVWIIRGEIATARAEERSKASAEAQKQLDVERKENQAKLDKLLGDLEQARKQKPTIQTVTKFVHDAPPAGAEVKIEPATPEKPAQLVLTGDPQKNLAWLQDMEISHRECDAKLEACGIDKDFINKKLLTMTQDRDNWEQTAKGGSKAKRFLKVLKVAGCAGGGAAIGSIWGFKGAAIGGASGSAGCAIFF